MTKYKVHTIKCNCCSKEIVKTSWNTTLCCSCSIYSKDLKKKIWSLENEIKDLKDKMKKQKPKTMKETYGDDSNHLCCPNCGMCIDCGDCKCNKKQKEKIAKD